MRRTFDHALVTGAAGAIGSAIAARIAVEFPRARVTRVDKNAVDDGVVVWDLAAPGALEEKWRAATKDAPVDLLVNCAGFMELRSFASTPWELGMALLDVDLVSPLRLMSLAVPSMRDEGRGAIVNVSSMAGLVPLRGAAFYGAAKAGLAMASEIARIDLARDGVDVVTVYPGPVASELERRARAQVPATFATRAIPTGDPDALARAILRALQNGAPRVIYPPFYAPAFEALPLARRFTERFSPHPRG